MRIVTGYRGEEHITSNDDQGRNQGIFGRYSYVLPVRSRFAATLLSSTELQIGDGEGVLQGVHFRIEPTNTETVTIPNGTLGKKRIDLLGVAYSKDPSTLVEDVALLYTPGEPSDDPVMPTYPEGDILAGDLSGFMNLYKITLDGVQVTSVEPLFTVLQSAAIVNSRVGSGNISGTGKETLTELAGNSNIAGLGNGTLTGALNTLKGLVDAIRDLRYIDSSTVTNFNNLTNIGVHALGREGGVTNSPTNAAYWRCIVIGVQGTQIKQIASPTAGNSWYVRTLFQGEWSTWQRLDNAVVDQSITDLNTAVAAMVSVGLKTSTERNLNNIKTPGYYDIGHADGVTNAPTSAKYWRLLVLGAETALQQIAYPTGGTGWFARTFANNAWSAWFQLDNTPVESIVANIGTRKAATISAAISAASGAMTPVTDITLEAGTWVVIGAVAFANANDGTLRKVALGSASGGQQYGFVQTPAVSGANTVIQVATTIELTANSPVYLSGQQSSANAINIVTSGTNIRAVRIK